MKKHLTYYETAWPADIAELTAVENKPFVGYLKKKGVKYTIIPQPIASPADNEIWYTTKNWDITPVSVEDSVNFFGTQLISNKYVKGKGVLVFESPVLFCKSWAETEVGKRPLDNEIEFIDNYTL